MSEGTNQPWQSNSRSNWPPYQPPPYYNNNQPCYQNRKFYPNYRAPTNYNNEYNNYYSRNIRYFSQPNSQFKERNQLPEPSESNQPTFTGDLPKNKNYNSAKSKKTPVDEQLLPQKSKKKHTGKNDSSSGNKKRWKKHRESQKLNKPQGLKERSSTQTKAVSKQIPSEDTNKFPVTSPKPGKNLNITTEKWKKFQNEYKIKNWVNYGSNFFQNFPKENNSQLFFKDTSEKLVENSSSSRPNENVTCDESTYDKSTDNQMKLSSPVSSNSFPLSPIPLPPSKSPKRSPTVPDRDSLMKLVKGPRNRKSEMLLTKWIKMNSQFRKKLTLPRFNMQMISPYQTESNDMQNSSNPEEFTNEELQQIVEYLENEPITDMEDCQPIDSINTDEENTSELKEKAFGSSLEVYDSRSIECRIKIKAEGENFTEDKGSHLQRQSLSKEIVSLTRSVQCVPSSVKNKTSETISSVIPLSSNIRKASESSNSFTPSTENKTCETKNSYNIPNRSISNNCTDETSNNFTISSRPTTNKAGETSNVIPLSTKNQLNETSNPTINKIDETSHNFIPSSIKSPSETSNPVSAPISSTENNTGERKTCINFISPKSKCYESFRFELPTKPVSAQPILQSQASNLSDDRPAQCETKPKIETELNMSNWKNSDNVELSVTIFPSRSTSNVNTSSASSIDISASALHILNSDVNTTLPTLPNSLAQPNEKFVMPCSTMNPAILETSLSKHINPAMACVDQVLAISLEEEEIRKHILQLDIQISELQQSLQRCQLQKSQLGQQEADLRNKRLEILKGTSVGMKGDINVCSKTTEANVKPEITNPATPIATPLGNVKYLGALPTLFNPNPQALLHQFMTNLIKPEGKISSSSTSPILSNENTVSKPTAAKCSELESHKVIAPAMPASPDVNMSSTSSKENTAKRKRNEKRNSTSQEESLPSSNKSSSKKHHKDKEGSKKSRVQSDSESIDLTDDIICDIKVEKESPDREIIFVSSSKEKSSSDSVPSSTTNNRRSTSPPEVSSSSTLGSTIEFQAHNDAIIEMQIFENKLYTASNDLTARCYDLLTLELKKEYKGHVKSVVCILVVQTENGNKVITGSLDQTIRFFNARNGHLIEELQFNSAISCLHHNWGKLFVGLTDGNIAILSLQSHRIIKTLECPEKRVTCLATATEGSLKLICAATNNNVGITVRDINTTLMHRHLVGHHKMIFALQVVENLLYSGSTDKTVMVFDLTNGDELKRIRLNCSVSGLHVKGNLILVSGYDGLIRIFDKNTYEILQYYYGAGKEMTTCMAFHEFMIYSGNRAGKIEGVPLDLTKNYLCKIGTCSMIFGLTDDLHYHLTEAHLPNMIQLDQCPWIGCPCKFQKGELEDIKKHLQFHVGFY